MAASKVDDRNFEQEVLGAKVPVLVDFWAPWCGPCRMMGGVVEELANELEGRAKVVKVNVDEAPEMAARFGVQSIPAFKVFHEGEVQGQQVGVVPKQSLLDLVEPRVN
ncbi:MAG: thioredoxin [Aureliella sp.]